MLVARRPRLNPRYRVRRVFAEETGVPDKTVQEIENAYRSSFSDELLATIERAYRLKHGAIEAALADDSLTDFESDSEVVAVPLTTDELRMALLERPPADAPQEVVDNWANYADWERAILHLPLSMDIRSWIHSSTSELLLIIARGIEADRARAAAEMRETPRRGDGSRAS